MGGLQLFTSLTELESIHDTPDHHASLLIEKVSLELARDGESLLRIASIPMRAETLSILIRKFRRYGIVVNSQDNWSEIHFSTPTRKKRLTPAQVKELLNAE